MNGIEFVCFEIITNVGSARSSYIEAIQNAKTKDFEAAKECMQQGKAFFLEGHRAHSKLIQQEASGEKAEFSLLLIHAEDQLMSAEGFEILAKEFIDVYQEMAVIKAMQ